MPKVVYTPAKGLVQETGSGFEVSGAPISVGKETLTNQVVTGTADTKANTDASAYFIVFGQATRYVVWFNVAGTDTAPTVASHPSLPTELVEVDINADTTDAQVAARMATALETAAAELEVDVNVAAFTIFGKTPYAAAGTATVGNLGNSWAIAQTEEGSGSGTVALKTYGVTELVYVDTGNANQVHNGAADLAKLTLADGANIGDRKIISRTDSVTAADPIVQVASCFDADESHSQAIDLTFDADDGTGGSIAELMWTGNQWLVINKGAGVTVQAV